LLGLCWLLLSLSAAVAALAPMEEVEPVCPLVDVADCTDWGCWQYGLVVRVMCCRVSVVVKGSLVGSVRKGSLAALSAALVLEDLSDLALL